jgi:hypothetical protein
MFMPAFLPCLHLRHRLPYVGALLDTGRDGPHHLALERRSV